MPRHPADALLPSLPLESGDERLVAAPTTMDAFGVRKGSGSSPEGHDGLLETGVRTLITCRGRSARLGRCECVSR